jgi:hypothetical protein
MTRVWETSRTKGSVLLLMLAIADYAHDDGAGAYPSIKTLAKKTRMSEQNVMRLVDTAEKLGELSIKRGRGRGNANDYTIILPGKPNKMLSNKNDNNLEAEKVTIPQEKVTSSLVHPLYVSIIGTISGAEIAPVPSSLEYLPQSQSIHILKEKLQPCGHPVSAIVNAIDFSARKALGGETHYCGECVGAAPPVCKKHNRGMLLNDGKYRCADCDFEEMPSVGAGMTPQPHTAGMADPQAEHREMITALAEVMHQATQCNGGKLAKTAQKLLRVPGVTPARIREWYAGPGCWWMLNDWRGQRGQVPDIAAINATVQMARDGVKPNGGNGHGASKESRLDQLQRVLGVRIDGKFGTDSKIDDNIVDGVSFKVVQ